MKKTTNRTHVKFYIVNNKGKKISLAIPSVSKAIAELAWFLREEEACEVKRTDVPLSIMKETTHLKITREKM